MKYPLNYRYLFCRELCCSLRGHVWKSSWRRRKNYDQLIQMSNDALPYELTSSGNPYYEYSPRWHYKCRRCRKISQERLEFIRTQLWLGLRDAYRMYVSSRREHEPLVVSVAFAVSQFFIHQDWMYSSIVHVIVDVSYNLIDSHYSNSTS